MHNISNLFYFGTILYMFWTVSLSIIRSLRLYIQNQVYFIRDLWLLASLQSLCSILCPLASSQLTSMTYTWRCMYSLGLLMMDRKTVWNM